MSAFGAGFGQQSGFGSSAFGSRSAFGGASAFGSQSNSIFGRTQSAFGSFSNSAPFSSSSAFASTNPSIFGAQSAPAFGSAFSASTYAPAPFGASQSAFPSASPFGASSSSLFAQQSNPALSSSAPAFAQSAPSSWLNPSSSTTPFVNSNPAPFNSFSNTSLFGAQPNSSVFGAPTQSQPGTAGVNWQLTVEYEGAPGAQSKYHSITMMPQFKAKCLEELRFEDYVAGLKGNNDSNNTSFPTNQSQPAFGASAATPFASAPAFGNASAFSSTPFASSGAAGASNTNPAFGSTTVFGQTAPAFAAQSTPPFDQSSNAFGVQSANAFGNTAFGMRPGNNSGANNQPLLGQSTGFSAVQQNPGLGNQNQQSQFGAFSSAQPFGGTSNTQQNPSLFANTQSAFFNGPHQIGASNFQNPGAQKSFSNTTGSYGNTMAQFNQSSTSGGLFGNFGMQPNQQQQQQGMNFGARPQIVAGPQNVGNPLGFQPNLPETYQAVVQHNGSTVAPAGVNYGTVLHNLQMIRAKVDEQQRLLAEQAKQAEKNKPQPAGKLSVVVLPSPPVVKVSGKRTPNPGVQGLRTRTPYRTKMRGSVARLSEAMGLTPRVSGTPFRGIAKDDPEDEESILPVTPAQSTSMRPTALFTPNQFSVSKRKPPRTSGGSSSLRFNTKMFPIPPVPLDNDIPKSEITELKEISPSRRYSSDYSVVPKTSKRSISATYLDDIKGLPNGEQKEKKAQSPSPSKLKGILHKSKQNDLFSKNKDAQVNGKKNFTGRISNSEEFMWAHPRPSTWSKKQGLDSDEQYMPDKYLPYLSKEGFYSEPSLQEMAAKDMTELQMIEDFTVGRHGYGKVTWIQPVDVRGLDLDVVVDIQQGEVAVFPEKEAHQLDAAARITLENMLKKKKGSTPAEEQQLEEKYERKLERYCEKHGLQFIDYNPENGVWVFEVPGFEQN